MKKRVLLVASVSTALIIVIFLGFRFEAWEFRRALQRKPADMTGHVRWEDRGPTPKSDERYTPQGLTWANGRLVFANSWNNERSRVYQINPENMEIEGHFDMPDEAGHTTGLAWDGHHLWAVDHLSNRCYRIDLNESLIKGQAVVVESFDTTLGGSSAACLLRINGETLLAISDFLHTRRTILIRHEAAAEDGTARGHIVLSYRNEGMSQGLEFDGEFLYESENKLGIDVINKIDLKLLMETGNSTDATVFQYPAPSPGSYLFGGVEDLAWDGVRFWTSHERSFRFYRGLLQ